MEKSEFIEAVAGYVRKYAKDYGICVHSPIIAQAVLESGWGKSKLSALYHNYFGLKCGSKWTGASVNMATKEEYTAGTITNITANFRVYPTMEEGIRGYFEFIQYARYANLKGITDPLKYLETIKADGYATDSKYVENNWKIVQQYGLTKYDDVSEVRDLTAEEKRLAVREAYKPFIGRNLYSQARRTYCLTPYSNGKYYSDCSSSVSYAYKAAGYGFGILNTVGMWQKKDFEVVPVTIEKGQIMNPEVLRIGDMLLYAGNDSGRAYAGYVGHVEMVGEINGDKVILYGHGSGNPKKTEMCAKNRSRYNTKAATKIGNRGLIRVVRFIRDDVVTDDGDEKVTADAVNRLTVKAGTWNIRNGPGKEYASIAVLNGGTQMSVIEKCFNGWYCVKAGNLTGYVSGKAVVSDGA